MVSMICCAWLMTSSVACSTSSSQAGDAPAPPPAGKDCAVVGSLPYWAHDEALDSYEQNADVIDYLSVFWYHISPDGKIRRYLKARESRKLIELAHGNGTKVLALIANLPDDERGPGGGWDPDRVWRVIHSPASRAAHIAEVRALVRRMGFDGVLIDYEALPGAYRDPFTRFIAELGGALRAENKILAVAIHPKTAEGDPDENNGSHAQDWDALYRHADQLHFMTYNQHTPSTAPGPVAAPEWMASVLRYAIDERGLPRSKIFMGVPLYGEEWVQTGPDSYRGLRKDITYADVQELAHEHDGEEMWSDEHQSPTMEFRDDDDERHILWFENQHSSRHKLALAAELGLCNLHMWRLGGEDPGLWPLLRSAGHGTPGSDRAGETLRRGKTALPPAEVDGGASSEQPAQPQGDGYPRLRGHASAEVEYYSKFAASNADHERDNWLTSIEVEQAFDITSRLELYSEVRVVLESDGEDPRFYSDFPYEGVYIRELWLRYQADHVSLFGGRYEPARDIRGYSPIFFGNYSTDLDLDERVGLGAAARFERRGIGRHRLTGHAFFRDTSRLSGEVISTQGRNRMDHGGVGNTERPNNVLVTLDGGTSDGTQDYTIDYTVGGGVQQGRLGALDERIYMAAVRGELPLGADRGSMEASLDVLSLRNAHGYDHSSDSVGVGVGYGDWPTYLGVAYWQRRITPGDQEMKRTDHITEIVARVGFGERIIMEAAYQNVRESGDSDHSAGVVVAYLMDWMVQ